MRGFVQQWQPCTALTSHQQLVSAGTRNSRTGVASAAGVCRPHAVAALTPHQQLVSARQSNATASEPPHRLRIGGWCVRRPHAIDARRADFASAARECEAIECDNKRAAALTSHQQRVRVRGNLMLQQAGRRTGVTSAAGVCRPHAIAALTSHRQLVSTRQSNATASERQSNATAARRLAPTALATALECKHQQR